MARSHFLLSFNFWSLSVYFNAKSCFDFNNRRKKRRERLFVAFQSGTLRREKKRNLSFDCARNIASFSFVFVHFLHFFPLNPLRTCHFIYSHSPSIYSRDAALRFLSPLQCATKSKNFRPQRCKQIFFTVRCSEIFLSVRSCSTTTSVAEREWKERKRESERERERERENERRKEIWFFSACVVEINWISIALALAAWLCVNKKEKYFCSYPFIAFLGFCCVRKWNLFHEWMQERQW